MINSGQVRLPGSFSGAQVDFASRASVRSPLIRARDRNGPSSDRRKFYVSGQSSSLGGCAPAVAGQRKISTATRAAGMESAVNALVLAASSTGA